jgi:signal transduction histidine kinase
MRRPYLRLAVAASPRGSMRKSSRGRMRARPARVTIAAVWRPWLAAAFVAGTVISGLPSFDRSRCGIAIPVGLLIVFAAAARRERGDAVISLALVLAGMVVLLLTDPLLDAGALFILPLTAGVWWIGRLVRRRAALAAELRERSEQLARTREESARLAVELERAVIASELDDAARRPLREIVALASEPPGPEAFASIERQGRDSLDDLRGMLGKLRGSELSTAPQPTLADLPALISGIEVVGEPRPLAAGTELAAYRMVEHALKALDGTRVRLRYLPDAIELEIRGRAIGDDAAVAAARERVRAHGGDFRRERRPDGTDVLRGRLPAVA